MDLSQAFILGSPAFSGLEIGSLASQSLLVINPGYKPLKSWAAILKGGSSGESLQKQMSPNNVRGTEQGWAHDGYRLALLVCQIPKSPLPLEATSCLLHIVTSYHIEY